MGEGRLWHSLGTDLVPLSTSASDGRAAIDLGKVLTALQPSARLLIDAISSCGQHFGMFVCCVGLSTLQLHVLL